jgi:hypothetical protein
VVSEKGMKWHLVLLILLSTLLNVSAQSTGVFQFIAKPDSIIEKRPEGYIYITSDTSSRPYHWIVPTPDNELVRSIYSNYISEIKQKYKKQISEFPVGDLPRKWNSVYMWNNKYYLYAPSDWMSNSGYYISDSVIYIASSDPSDIYVITGLNKNGADEASFSATDLSGKNNYIEIKLIDRSLGIYEWTIRGKDNESKKFLMQNSDYVTKLKMIICDCGDTKCLMEFKFDENR